MKSTECVLGHPYHVKLTPITTNGSAPCTPRPCAGAFSHRDRGWAAGERLPGGPHACGTLPASQSSAKSVFVRTAAANTATEERDRIGFLMIIDDFTGQSRMANTLVTSPLFKE